VPEAKAVVLQREHLKNEQAITIGDRLFFLVGAEGKFAAR